MYIGFQSKFKILHCMSEVLYQIALTQVAGIGAVQAKNLIEQFDTAEAVFKAKRNQLSAVPGIGDFRVNNIKAFTEFHIGEEEVKFCEKHHIKILTLKDADYPQRLLHCYDAPTVLFYRGNANLNAQKIISVIGTRTNSDYGKQITEKLIEDLKEQNVLVVSGLAFGIDAIAHKAALQNNLSTVAVLAHGLDTIYPAQHKSFAKEMLNNGGLLTEFMQHTKADKHNFPKRNRIVAGMADCTVIVETADKGGSMITAELAYNYNRELFAVPARVTDAKSAGCLKLIQQNKATLLTDAKQLCDTMLWTDAKTKKPKKQKELFIELSDDEKLIMELLHKKDETYIDEIGINTGLGSSAVAAALLNLELQNVVSALPGKMYKIL